MKEKIRNYIFIIILGIIVSIPLFNSNFNIYIDDGIQHVSRLMGTFQSVTEGQTFPVIMSQFCNQFGYSWNLFYSPLTAYIPLLFKLFTSSFIMCLKLFMLVITILSGISMYEFIKKITKNQCAALLGSTIYMFAPYRLTDMYARIAVAELVSFIFLPMVFQSLYTIFNSEEKKKRKFSVLLIISASGLILSHTVIAMYTAIFAFIYVLVNIKKLKDITIVKELFINLILIICITSFFWAPMLEHKISANYEVFKEGRMERTDVLIAYKLDLTQFLYTKQGSFSFEIGLVTLIGIVLTLLTFKKVDKSYKKIYLFSLIVGIISVIMTLKWFPFEKLPSILKMLQFSFRMLEFSSFFLAVVAAINYSMLIKNFGKKDLIVLTVITVLLVVPLTKNLPYNEDINENALWPSVPVTEFTSRVHAGCASFEYLPSKAFDNLDYIKAREDRVYVIQGNAQIDNQNKNGTDMTFTVSDVEENTILELPYIYYLGYDVTIEQNEITNKIQNYESENGFVEIHLDNIENANIIVKYSGTNIMKWSMVISIIAFTITILYYAIVNIKYARVKKQNEK